MANAPMARLCFPGLEGSPWPGTSQLPTPTPESHLLATTLTAGAAADKAAANKEMKYSALANTHIFFPVVIETSGVMNQLAVDLVSETGRRISSDYTQLLLPGSQCCSHIKSGTCAWLCHILVATDVSGDQ